MPACYQARLLRKAQPSAMPTWPSSAHLQDLGARLLVGVRELDLAIQAAWGSTGGWCGVK